MLSAVCCDLVTIRSTVLAASLRRACSGAGVPNLAFDLPFVNRVESNRHDLLCHESSLVREH